MATHKMVFLPPKDLCGDCGNPYERMMSMDSDGTVYECEGCTHCDLPDALLIIRGPFRVIEGGRPRKG